jgi:hypothetical protein
MPVAFSLECTSCRPCWVGCLGNRRKVILDCQTAVGLNRGNIKAYWRACTANLQLGHYGEAIKWADDGLLQDPANKQLVEERQKAVKLKAAEDKKARQKAAEVRKKEKKEAELIKAFQDRGLRLQKAPEVAHSQRDMTLKGIAAAGGEVFVDDKGLLHWPASFLCVTAATTALDCHHPPSTATIHHPRRPQAQPNHLPQSHTITAYHNCHHHCNHHN